MSIPVSAEPTMPTSRLWLLTAAAMVAFASNSILCRLALQRTQIDPASFTAARLLSGALMLWLLVRSRPAGSSAGQGSWASALALFVYAASFSFAYTQLPAGVGALLLFGAVQATMFGVTMWRGERHGWAQYLGMGVAMAGLVMLVLPGRSMSAPPVLPTLLMLSAGAAWGAYSLRGRRAGNPLVSTQGNFARAVPMALALLGVALQSLRWDIAGLAFAVASGALASAIGYAVWYSVTPILRASTAATVQLSAPVLAALGGVVLLGETLVAMQYLASAAILLGIWTSSRPTR